MKKALAAIVLLASSAGLFALPAAARDRDDWYGGNARYNSSYSYRNNYNNGYQDWNYGRGDRHAMRERNQRDYRYRGYSSYGREWR